MSPSVRIGIAGIGADRTRKRFDSTRGTPPQEFNRPQQPRWNQDAVKWQTRAIEAAPASGISEGESRLDLYKSGKPYRDDLKKWIRGR